MKRKTAVVTGSSRGIGRAIALKYADEGYDTAVCCRSGGAELLGVQEEILARSVNCVAFAGDMGNYEDARAFFDIIRQEYGHIDILVNNAGISHLGLLQDMSTEDWNTILSANLSSVFHCSKLAVEMMLPRKAGKILSISSVWGCAGASMEVAYSATKGGVNAFTRALAKELAPSNIQVNAIACGIIDTEMNAFLSEEELNCILEEIPAGRLGTAEEVAHLAYALNEKNDYLTGQIIILDGGWL